MLYLCSMIRENISLRMYDLNMTQRTLSKTTGIEYTAINTYLNGHKGMWFERVQSILDEVGLSAEGTYKSDTPLSIQKSCWMEIKKKNINVRETAKTLNIGYCTLTNFLHGRIGMSIDKVERLMSFLGIKLVPCD